MADDRYGGGSWRGGYEPRDYSRRAYDEQRRDDHERDDRGFLERAGDRVRSMVEDVFDDEGSGGRDARGGHHPLDDHYRGWRQRHIDEMDRDYDEYRRERQRRFHSDFESWRNNRGGDSGLTRDRTETGAQSSGGSGTEPVATGGAEAGGAAGLSASEASTGSNPRGARGRKVAE